VQQQSAATAATSNDPRWRPQTTELRQRLSAASVPLDGMERIAGKSHLTLKRQARLVCGSSKRQQPHRPQVSAIAHWWGAFLFVAAGLVGWLACQMPRWKLALDALQNGPHPR